MMNSIEVQNAEKYYGSDKYKNKILDGLNMNIRPGTIYSLIGASGCGKTTLLSCILGMKNLDSGTIKVLGHTVNHEKTSKVAHLIGYMPQNTALIPELTIRETLYYFGNIFQMNGKLLKERFEMINDLLELPNENCKIENLSGGQQRRVSIAASIIHNPLILILDEPTVGLDTMLKNKIWNFLLDTTKSSQLSVIITTHYISEAEKAHRCGLMRDGVLLAEDSPKNILSRCGAESLDQAFLNLCILSNRLVVKNVTKFDSLTDFRDNNDKNIEEVNEAANGLFEKRKKFSKQTILALLDKEVIRMKRYPGKLLFTILLPILNGLTFSYGVGGNPVGLKIGIVNHELNDFNNCNEYLAQNASFLDINGKCVYNQRTLCFLLNEIDDEIATKVFYDSYDKAFEDAQKLRIAGIISLPQNFTEFMFQHHFGIENNREEGIIIQLDRSDFHISRYLGYHLYKAFIKFNEKLFNGCGYNKKSATVPINFEETFFGTFDSDFKRSMLAPLLTNIVLFQSFGLSCFTIAQSRIDGVWNRTLLSGVTLSEILIMQIILIMAETFIELVLTCLTTLLIIDVIIIGSYGLLALFSILFSLSGSLIGITISSISENYRIISVLLFLVTILTSILSGSFWPLEGQPTLLKYFSYTFPTALPAISVRNIMLKGYGITHPSVYIGIIILLAWIVVSIITSMVVLKKRKFAET